MSAFCTSCLACTLTILTSAPTNVTRLESCSQLKDPCTSVPAHWEIPIK